MPPPAPVPEAPASPTAAGGGLDRDVLVQAWGDHILRGLPARAKALYSAGRFVSAEGGTAVFALPNAAHCDRCQDVRGVVESAVSAHMGYPVTLQLVVDGSAGPVASGGQGGQGGSAGAEAGGAPRGGTAGGGRAPGPADGSVGTGATVDDEEYFDMDDAAEAVPVESVAEAMVRDAFPGIQEV